MAVIPPEASSALATRHLPVRLEVVMTVDPRIAKERGKVNLVGRRAGRPRSSRRAVERQEVAQALVPLDKLIDIMLSI
jgi:hypothetical protein